MVYEFEEIEKSVVAGAEPEDMKLHDLAAYTALNHLYALYYLGRVREEDASRMKRKIRAEYEKEKKAFHSSREYMAHHAKLFREIESAGDRFGTERTMEAAIEFHKAVYGVGLKELKSGVM